MKLNLPFKEKAGVISENPIWIWYDSCWMYTGNTLLELLKEIILYWKRDRNIIG